jgi:VWFA-related protein
MRNRLIASLIVLLALPALPQQKLIETIEVRVANVDVVVRDRHGKPVTGLTKDDFELYENGVKQEITNFYEVRRDEASGAQLPASEASAAVPSELTQRRLVLFVDCASLRPARKQLVLAAVEKFVNRMQPGDEAMLVAWRLGLQIVTPFTSDKAAIKRGMATLERLGPAGEVQERSVDTVRREIQNLIRLGQNQVITWTEAYSRAKTLVDRHAQQIIMYQRPLLDAVGRMCSTLGGLDGKKVLVLVSAFVPERPGAELYRYAYDQFRPYIDRNVVQDQAADILADQTNNDIDLQALTGVMGSAMPDDIEQLAKAASTNGVVMYPIDAAEAQSELSASNSQTVEFDESFSRHENTAASFNHLAKMTGGVAVTQTSNYDYAFDTVSRDLDSYYSLGYKPKGEDNLLARNIVVKAKNRAYRIRTRETLILKTPDDQMNDRVIANLYTEGLSSNWPITIKIGAPRADGHKFDVPVQVVMPSTITLLPQDNALVGGFTVYIAVGKGDGRTSEVIRRPTDLKIPASAEPLVRAKPMTFTTAIRVGPGENLLSVAVIDQVSGTTGYARTKIMAR